MNFAKTVAMGACLTATLAAGGALAKAHDQGQKDVPGTNVGSTTVSAAQTLGGSQGKRPADKGPMDSPAVTKAGR